MKITCNNSNLALRVSKYVMLDYISTTGANYLDTNITRESGMSYEFTFSPSARQVKGYAFGTRDQFGGSYSVAVGTVEGSDMLGSQIVNSKEFEVANASQIAMGNTQTDDFYTFSWTEGGTVTIKNSAGELAIEQSPAKSNLNYSNVSLYLFNAHVSSGVYITNTIFNKIKNFKVTKADGTIINLIPIMNNGVPCYVDTETDTIYNISGDATIKYSRNGVEQTYSAS